MLVTSIYLDLFGAGIVELGDDLFAFPAPQRRADCQSLEAKIGRGEFDVPLRRRPVTEDQ